MKWYEFHLKRDADLGDFYRDLDNWPTEVTRWHHFWDEPWNPKAFVVRVELDPAYWVRFDSATVARVYQWDESPDRELYGDKFDAAMAFFQAGSTLNPTEWERGKFIHCFLNSQGMEWRDEAFFLLKLGWKRLIMPWKISRFTKFGRAYRKQMERDAIDREARKQFEVAA